MKSTIKIKLQCLISIITTISSCLISKTWSMKKNMVERVSNILKTANVMNVNLSILQVKKEKLKYKKIFKFKTKIKK